MMTDLCRKYLIDTYELSKKIKDRSLELTFPRDIAAYEAGYEDGTKENATRWHYVINEDYPRDIKLVLMKITGCYVIGWIDAGVWYFDSWNGKRKIPSDMVLAWQYIEPPEEV